MAKIEIPDVCEFHVEHDQIEFKTATNGDFIEIRKINMDQNAAAALAWLINAGDHLTIEIKLKEP